MVTIQKLNPKNSRKDTNLRLEKYPPLPLPKLNI